MFGCDEKFDTPGPVRKRGAFKYYEAKTTALGSVALNCD